MAKVTKAAAAAAPVTTEGGAAPAPKAPAVAKANDRAGRDLFVPVFQADGKTPIVPNGKVAPQAQVIINTIVAAGANGIRRDDLVKSLTGVLVTRQPVGRIVTYYQKLIQTVGSVKLVPEVAPAATVPAPAAAPAA